MDNWLKSDNKGVLRFLTAGSVDDGKSTLIGRLLYDSKSIFEDQLDALVDDSNGEVNLANLTDCLLYTSPSPRDKRQSRMPSSA